MRAVNIIEKKRDGLPLDEAEINWLIAAYTRGDVPDYQMAAWAMATVIRGMTMDEVTALTLAMAHSGDMLDLSAVGDYVVDKHSSGGVGDKTSLIVLPLVASAGVPVAKLSGRALGLTGGTLDKMEAIAGFSSNLSEDRLIEQARTIGLALAGQTRDLAPADGKLYALRDVTGTVASIPLIASSIMCKKLAAGAQGIVLDVKVGSGAFMQDLGAARELAQTMVKIGRAAGRDMVALISDMNQPLGNAVGNALEVREALETLRGGGPGDLREHSLDVAAHMLRLAGRGEKWPTTADARSVLQTRLADGSAFLAFRRMVAAQGGDIAMVDDPSLLPTAQVQRTLNAEESGSVAMVNAERVARAAFDLGAGREKKGDPIDMGVGVVVHVKVGDRVATGQPLATIHAKSEAEAAEAEELLRQAIRVQDQAVAPLPLFYDVIT